MKFSTLKVLANTALVALLSVSASGYAEDSSREITLTPYLWGAGLTGEVATLPGAGPIEVDVSFSDILDNLDMALMGVLELRRGDYGFFGDILYVDIDTDELDTPGPVFSDVRYEQQLTSLTAAATRRWETLTGYVDALVGVRYWDLDNEIRLGAAAAPAFSTSGQDSWADFIVGIKGRTKMSTNWSLNGWIIGGGGDSNSTVDVMGGINYTLKNGVVLTGGYRHLAVDYEEAGFLFDVELSGPIFGATFIF